MKGSEQDASLIARVNSSLAMAAPVVVVGLESDGRIAYVNPYFEKLTGFRQDELKNRDWFDTCLPKEVRENTRAVFEKAKAGMPPAAHINPVLTATGGQRLIEWHSCTVREAGDLVLAIGLDVTDRLAAEQRAEDERTRLRSLIDSMHLAVGMYALDGTLLEANQFPLTAAGLKREEVIGMKFWDTPWWRTEEDRQDIKQAVVRAANGEIVNVVKEIDLIDGRRVTLDNQFRPMRNDAGEITNIVGSGFNVTEAVKAKAELQRERERLIRAQSIAKIGSWELDFRTNELSWSPEVYRLIGVDPDETPTYERFLEWIHPEDRDLVDAAYQNSLKTRQPYSLNHRVIGPDGEIRWLSEQCETAFDEHGNPLISRGSVQDITVAHEAREALKRAQQTLSSILKVSPEGIIIVREDATIQMFSDGAEDIFRCRRADVIDQPMDVLIPEEFRAGHGALMRGFTESGRKNLRMSERTEIKALRRDGEVFSAEASVSKVDTGSGLVYAVILRDVSNKVAYQDELRNAKIQAEAASAAKTSFLATMSHELRTPMNGIIGMLSILTQNGLSEKHQKMADIAYQSAESLMTILNDILEFSRIEFGQLQIEDIPFRLADIFKQVGSLHRLKADAGGIDFKMEIDPGVPDEIRGDPGRLTQILHNLIGNALKFTEAGHVHVTAHPGFCAAGGTCLEIAVEDTGIGIPEEAQARIFDRFMQADSSTTREFGGSGLGLAIVKGLAEAQGGDIEVRSEPGKGSCFTVHLPLREAHIAETRPAEGMGDAAALGDISVLLVEDNALNIETMKLLLGEFGITPDIATTGLGALERVAAQRYDVIFMDIQMPEMDGETAIKHLRERESAAGGNPVHVLAFTADVVGERVRHFESIGFDGVLGKPVNARKLYEALVAVAGQDLTKETA